MNKDNTKPKPKPPLTLAALLYPISVKTFLEDYFGKRPLLVRGRPGKFDAFMKPDKFIYGLDRVPEIRCVFNELRQATISPQDIREMFEAGATICVTGIDSAHSSLRSAARRIKKEIGYAGSVDFRGYLSPPGSGFDIHYDARVATTLQLEGTKTWWYSTSLGSSFPTENSSRENMSEIRRNVSKMKFEKVVLFPGDLLCIPPGIWHKAQAGEGGSLALNMAFNHNGATVLDLVLQELRDTLCTDIGCREPFYTGTTDNSTKQLKTHIAQCVTKVSDMLNIMGDENVINLLNKTSKRLTQHQK